MDIKLTPAQLNQTTQTSQASTETATAQSATTPSSHHYYDQPYSQPQQVVETPSETEPSATTSSVEVQTTETFVEDLIQPHFAILQLGVSIWNQWRLDDPHIIPNLQGADLREMRLENINLSRANLRGAQLDSAYLFDADFQRADLRGASLVRTMLVGANLHRAKLSDTRLDHAYLNHCDLSNANLTGACLQQAQLHHALLTEATFVNARLTSAEMAESEDLTARQLQVAKDVHLAFLSEAIKERLRGLSQIDPNARFSTSLPKKVRPQKRNKPAAASVSEQLIPSIEIKFQPRLAS